MPGRVCVFFGSFIIDTDGWAGYPFSIAGIALSVRLPEAKKFVNRIPSLTSLLRQGVVRESPPRGPIRALPKLSRTMNRIFGPGLFSTLTILPFLIVRDAHISFVDL